MVEIAGRRKATATVAPGERARSRILDTAEELFAREGAAAVTLRSIATAAEVNGAAVNYYFGSKEKLFEEMFLRRIVPLNEERLRRLEGCIDAAGGAPTLEGIITAYVSPALELSTVASASARAIVVQYSLGRVLAMPEVDTKLVRYYASVREAYVPALRKAVPSLTPQEAIWRYYWMGGCVLVSLAVPSGMVEAAGDPACASASGVQTDLVGFLAAGIRTGQHQAPSKGHRARRVG